MQKEQKIARIWILQTLLTVIIILISVILLNYLNDPLWVFNHKNHYNKTRLGFNERQQKTNLLYFDQKDYDSILLGNSKVTYINQNKFSHAKLFNYAVSAMHSSEYQGYIDFFKDIIAKDPKYILIGLDFHNCLQKDIIHSYQDPKFYIQNSLSPYYKFKHLLSFDSFGYSLRNLSKSLSKKYAIYDSKNAKTKIGFKKQYDENYQVDLNKIKSEVTVNYPNAIYDQKLAKNIINIKNSNPNSRVIIIFLPDFMPYFTINKNKFIYDRCLKDITEIIGQENIINFMKLNEITANINNYYDGSHFRNEIGDLILEYLLNRTLRTQDHSK